MKKTLLFAILALSINALAQSKHPTFWSNENVQDRMHNSGMKISNLHSEMNLGKIIKPQPLKPQDLIQIVDSVYQWQWDTISVGWIIGYKIINIVYDAKHNMTSSTGQSWNGSAWENSDKSTSTYDANNNETSNLYQEWNGSNWVDVFKYTSTYDAKNNLTKELDQRWNDSDWINTYQYTYTYDANNNRTSLIFQYWNGSDWVNSGKHTYSYDANNNMTSELHQRWNGSDWVNSDQDTFTYDANNNLTSDLMQDWDDGSWENSMQYTYTYDAKNNLTKELDQSWNGSDWENYEQSTITYDANNNQTSQLYQSWNGSNWVNVWQYEGAYDANNFEKSHTYKNWNAAGTKIESGDSSYSFYHTVLGINGLMAQNGNLTVYPNPASTQITIEICALPTQSQLSISNLNGQQLITRQITSPKTQVDISSLPSGVYFVRLTSDKTVATGKIIKQ